MTLNTIWQIDDFYLTTINIKTALLPPIVPTSAKDNRVIASFRGGFRQCQNSKSLPPRAFLSNPLGQLVWRHHRTLKLSEINGRLRAPRMRSVNI